MSKTSHLSQKSQSVIKIRYEANMQWSSAHHTLTQSVQNNMLGTWFTSFVSFKTGMRLYFNSISYPRTSIYVFVLRNIIMFCKRVAYFFYSFSFVIFIINNICWLFFVVLFCSVYERYSWYAARSQVVSIFVLLMSIELSRGSNCFKFIISEPYGSLFSLLASCLASNLFA